MANGAWKAIIGAAICLVAIAGLGAIWMLVHVENRWGRPFATFTSELGEVGDLRIGESKLDILRRLKTQSFSIDPRPSECPIVWIEVDAMSEVYRSCLLNANHWEEGKASTEMLCPKTSNVFTKLIFTDGTLTSVRTECWHPK